MSEPRIRHRPLPDRRPHRLGGLDGGGAGHQGGTHLQFVGFAPIDLGGPSSWRGSA